MSVCKFFSWFLINRFGTLAERCLVSMLHFCMTSFIMTCKRMEGDILLSSFIITCMRVVGDHPFPPINATQLELNSLHLHAPRPIWDFHILLRVLLFSLILMHAAFLLPRWWFASGRSSYSVCVFSHIFWTIFCIGNSQFVTQILSLTTPAKLGQGVRLWCTWFFGLFLDIMELQMGSWQMFSPCIIVFRWQGLLVIFIWKRLNIIKSRYLQNFGSESLSEDPFWVLSLQFQSIPSSLTINLSSLHLMGSGNIWAIRKR